MAIRLFRTRRIVLLIKAERHLVLRTFCWPLMVKYACCFMVVGVEHDERELSTLVVSGFGASCTTLQEYVLEFCIGVLPEAVATPAVS